MNTNNQTGRNLRVYLEANKRMLALDNPLPQLTVGTLNSFLAVAIWGTMPNGEPSSLEDIQRRLGIPMTTFSGHLALLQEGPYRVTREGMGLIKLYENPINRRQKFAKLTHKGKALADNLSYLLEGPQNGYQT